MFNIQIIKTFLSKKGEFAKAFGNRRLTFIKLRSKVIATMGNKYATRKISVYLVLGDNKAVETSDETEQIVNK